MRRKKRRRRKRKSRLNSIRWSYSASTMSYGQLVLKFLFKTPTWPSLPTSVRKQIPKIHAANIYRGPSYCVPSEHTKSWYLVRDKEKQTSTKNV
jgi:hypothetical protein